jgi:hypothetical protein
MHTRAHVNTRAHIYIRTHSRTHTHTHTHAHTRTRRTQSPSHRHTRACTHAHATQTHTLTHTQTHTNSHKATVSTKIQSSHAFEISRSDLIPIRTRWAFHTRKLRTCHFFSKTTTASTCSNLCLRRNLPEISQTVDVNNAHSYCAVLFQTSKLCQTERRTFINLWRHIIGFISFRLKNHLCLMLMPIS